MQYIYYVNGIKWSENNNMSTMLSLIAIFSRKYIGTKFATMTGHNRILNKTYSDVEFTFKGSNILNRDSL